ncbi:MAG: GDP-L-fucose synthase [Verrucomicrobia bacterium]|nr:GDP-L-fucose synthase [Verrucomicrobiota bacterium]MBU1735440.1 GDP-L-fucose synthase [Verrucomicrobiota bacterium]MBU1856835.1 GDP-L-fucose synthase [Verrucomicrobiota bacterium]
MHSQFKRILVTGATGFLGHHIVPALRASFKAEIIGVGRKDYDLLVGGQAEAMLAAIKPDAIIHLAARVGGIIANEKYPAEFFYQNVTINTALFHAAYKAGIKKLLTLMGGCSYPAKASSPIGEDQMWNGFPQSESASYSVAKKIILVQSATYRQQYGFNSIVLVPGNVYGEWDNFNLESAHVIPALIRRYAEAAEQNLPEVTAFGTGRPTRDFVYAGDVAATIPWFLTNYDNSEPVNISTGTRITIRELAETVKKATGYKGRIVWDESKPDGQMDKIFDVTRLYGLGLRCQTKLDQGLARTVKWFLQARQEGTVRL